MKRLFLSACLCLSVAVAPNALAQDDFSDFSMKGVGNDIDPFAMSCRQYAALNPETRNLVTAYLEGYSAEGSSTVFVPGAVKNFEAGILASCAKSPAKPLDDVLDIVQYDVPEGGSELRCSDLNGFSNRNDVVRAMLWTQGYLESELAENEEADQNQGVHLDTFREDVAAVLDQCRNSSSDPTLIDVTRKILMGEE